MGLNESAISTPDLLREWSLAHDMLTHFNVPAADGSGQMWSLPSRVEWLGKQQAEARQLYDDLRGIIRDHERANEQPRLLRGSR